MDALLRLPAFLRARLAAALAAGLLDLPSSPAALRAALGSDDLAAQAQPATDALADLGVSAVAAASWLRSLEATEARYRRPELVWTGPAVVGLPARDTRQVYDELLGGAERSAWISTYAFFDGPLAFATLARRMDERPELKVRLLLNIQRRAGDTSTADAIASRFAQRFWSHDWPGSQRPDVYYDPRSLEPERRAGVLHAKAVVVDDEAVFVTSANLTAAALDINVELGILVRDPALATSVGRHFGGLVERGVLRSLMG